MIKMVYEGRILNLEDTHCKKVLESGLPVVDVEPGQGGRGGGPGVAGVLPAQLVRLGLVVPVKSLQHH